MKIEIETLGKTCTFYKDITADELAEIRRLTNKWQKDGDLWAKTKKNLECENCGSTIITSKHILVVMSRQTSRSEFLNTLAHEVRHVVDTLTSDGQTSPAQLTGHIFSHFADFV